MKLVEGEREELGTHGKTEGLLMGPLLPLAPSLIAACLQDSDLCSNPKQSATRGHQLKQYV